MPPKVQNLKPRVVCNRYKVIRQIGKGAFGTAYLIEDFKSSEKFKVLKEIPIGDIDPEETVDAVHEAKLLGKLSHSAILKFYNGFFAQPYFCMVTEYCDEGDLDQRICDLKEKKLLLPLSTTVCWLIQILLGVEYLHGKRILHRDLKTKNIFLKNDSVKIGDFGISRMLMNSADMASTFLGTPFFMSPELLNHQGYNAKSDIWSVGCILYEMCAQEHAFKGPGLMKILFSICDDPCPELPLGYRNDLQPVLERMLVKDPQQRGSAREILRMPYLRDRSRQLRDEAVVVTSTKSETSGSRRRKHEKKSERKKETEAEGNKSSVAYATVSDVHLEDVEECDDLVPSGEMCPDKSMHYASMTAAEAETYYKPDFEEEEVEEDATLQFQRELERMLAQSGRIAQEFEDAPDDATSGLFGPDGFEQTLTELRQNCEMHAANSRGAFDFKAVYKYLSANRDLPNNQKAAGLSRLTTDSEAVRMVEKLVFLESRI